MTPNSVADFMASLFSKWSPHVMLLDPGAGLGSLTEAFCDRFLASVPEGSSLTVQCYEVDGALAPHLQAHLNEAGARITSAGHAYSSVLHQKDFIELGAFAATMGGDRFSHAILNPPYKKISNGSNHRKFLRTAGIETVNLYTAFLGITISLMQAGGEIVAIVPRSFCNGTYFRPFRDYLFSRAALTHIHVFTSRTRAFHEDEVLQENIIVRLVRDGNQDDVVVSGSTDATFSDYAERRVPFEEIVKRDDDQRFIHIPIADLERSTGLFDHSLGDLGIEVSTGPVVDFRLREHWLAEPKGDWAPLLYGHHFRGGGFEWPRSHKKPNALVVNGDTQKWLLPAGNYTLTKRFSSKEERRRVVSYLVEREQLPYDLYGFENHLNVFHISKRGLAKQFARGLCLFLNSSVVDQYFRSFSGHTQVNATDLRVMRYPSRDRLTELGAHYRHEMTQQEIDDVVVAKNG